METNFDIRSIEVLKRLLGQSKLANQSLRDIEPEAMRAISYPDMRAAYSTLVLIGDLNALAVEYQRAFDETRNRAFRVKGMVAHRLIHSAFAMQWDRASIRLYSYLKDTHFDVSTKVTENLETFYDTLVNPQTYQPEPAIKLDLNLMPPEAAERMQALMLEFMEEGIINSPIAMETDEDRAERLSRENASNGYEVWEESSPMPDLTEEGMREILDRLSSALDANGELPFPRHRGKGMDMSIFDTARPETFEEYIDRMGDSQPTSFDTSYNGSERPNKPPAIPPKGFIHQMLKTLISNLAGVSVDELDDLLYDKELDKIVNMDDAEFEAYIANDTLLALSGKDIQKVLAEKRHARTMLKELLPWLRKFLGGDSR